MGSASTRSESAVQRADEQLAKSDRAEPRTARAASLRPVLLVILCDDEAHRHGIYSKNRRHGRDA